MKIVPAISAYPRATATQREHQPCSISYHMVGNLLALFARLVGHPYAHIVAGIGGNRIDVASSLHRANITNNSKPTSITLI